MERAGERPKTPVLHFGSAEANTGMASPAAQPIPSRPQDPEPPPPPPRTLTDDILREIFIRLSSPADLARTSAALASFRRVITDPSFLRRFRALYPPPLLGILAAGFHPAEPPHPCAPAAGAVAHAVDFSCSFLPSPDLWRRRDVRDGRVLLSRATEGGHEDDGGGVGETDFMELAVCDPLSGRYVLLPAVPDDLAASVQQQNLLDLKPFLAPAGDDDDGTSFRVIYMARCEAKLVAFLFSSDAGGWGAFAFEGWGALVTGTSPWCAELSWRHYAHGRICWVLHLQDKLLVLDTRRMEFSTVDLPPGNQMEQIAIVEAAEGRLGMFVLVFHIQYGKFDLCYAVYAEGENRWRLEKITRLPFNYRRYNIMGTAGGYMLLQGLPKFSIPSPDRPDCVCFSVELKTFQLERFCGTKHLIIGADLFASFPPPLSPPSI